VLPFIAKLYPRARYVVLTRHPAAIWSSYANSFFDGDYVAARAFNPILNRYVPAMARFLRERPVPLVRVAYEDLVQRPEDEIRRVLAFSTCLRVRHRRVRAARARHEGTRRSDGREPARAAGDRFRRQVGRRARQRPGEARARPRHGRAHRRRRSRDLGLPARDVLAPVEAAARAGAKPLPPPAFDRYRLQRKLLVTLRRNIHQKRSDGW